MTLSAVADTSRGALGVPRLAPNPFTAKVLTMSPEQTVSASWRARKTRSPESLHYELSKNGGEGGIRTHGPLTVTRFRVVAERLLLGLKTQKIL